MNIVFAIVIPAIIIFFLGIRIVRPTHRGLIETLNELSRAGTTIIVSTHDAEAIPELADRIVVISRGEKLCEGKTTEVLQDKKMLEASGLEPPTIVDLFGELKARGYIDEVPLTTAEGKEALLKLLKDKNCHTLQLRR